MASGMLERLQKSAEVNEKRAQEWKQSAEQMKAKGYEAEALDDMLQAANCEGRAAILREIIRQEYETVREVVQDAAKWALEVCEGYAKTQEQTPAQKQASAYLEGYRQCLQDVMEEGVAAAQGIAQGEGLHATLSEAYADREANS